MTATPPPLFSLAGRVVLLTGATRGLGFEMALVFYNAMLPELAGPERVGRVSGWGWSLGYCGGLLSLGVSLGHGHFDRGDAPGGLEVHWTPGHTEGSVFYRHEATKTLLTGDSLLTSVPPLVIRRGLSLAYHIFSTSRDTASRAESRAPSSTVWGQSATMSSCPSSA